MEATTTTYDIKPILNKLGISDKNKGCAIGNDFFGEGEEISSHSPTDGALIATVSTATEQDYEKVIEASQKAFKEWRMVPAPERGELIRKLGVQLREKKEDLGKLVSYEMGKSLQEGYGEVQEMIDICDFALGQSRQLYGMTTHSERPKHRMYEQYHPLGSVGVITAFNFPVAVWAWNTCIALVCGDSVIWKPSEKTPLCSLACQKILADIIDEEGHPAGISCIANGDYKVGQYLTNDKKVALVSATGSIRMGKIVAQTVGARLGKTILELGGNNGIIVTPDADLDTSIIGAVFGAVGTAGQRCTSTRRLIVHDSIYDKVKDRLTKAYEQLRIGTPMDENNHVGPLIDKDAVSNYLNALDAIKEQGGKLLIEGEVMKGEGYESGCYVRPVIAEVENEFPIVQEETFAPILYLIKYTDLDEALEKHNGVVQGLSSAIMTQNLREAERFLSAEGSDCGIANVNIGTSGAEIGGAFGGEKETGGGRESGSDAWKAYMRRQTNTINYSTEVPLAQGIKFDI